MSNFLVNLFLLKLVRISGFSSLFLAIAVLSAHLPESAKNTAIPEKREENPEILTNLMRKRLTRFREFGLPGVVPRCAPPRTPGLHFKTRRCRLLARRCLGIPRPEKWPNTGHADDWGYCPCPYFPWSF